MVTAYVIEGLGIGCQDEVAHAFERAGAKALKVHYRQLLSGDVSLSDSQIINLSGGFLHGDMMGAAMCAANELERAAGFEEDDTKRFKDMLWECAERGNVIYGQCNGFQVLVKTGLLPAIDDDYSKQTVTLTRNTCGNYRVDNVLHKATPHFAFKGVSEDDLRLWCRHAEGRLLFHSKYGSVSEEEGERNREQVNKWHVLLRYVHPETGEPTEEFPWNPNGSVDGIAGLVNSNGNIFGHMAHP
ncbi:MAG: phosphoribosylformylglycinamidine synthase subunit PurQ, partial [archaeon]